MNHFWRSVISLAVIGLFAWSCEKEEVQVALVDDSQPVLTDGIMTFRDMQHYRNFVREMEQRGGTQSDLRAWASSYPEYRSIVSEYEKAMEAWEDGQFASVDELMTEFGHAVAIDDRSGFTELTNISSDPVEGFIPNQDGLVIIGDRVRKVTWEAILETNIEYIDDLRENDLEQIPLEEKILKRELLQTAYIPDNGRTENGCGTHTFNCEMMIHNYYYNNYDGSADRRLKGQVELLNAGASNAKVVFTTSSWKGNYSSGTWSQYKRKRIQCRIDWWNGGLATWAGRDSGRTPNASKETVVVPSHLLGFSNPASLCLFGYFESFHLLKSSNNKDYCTTLTQSGTPCFTPSGFTLETFGTHDCSGNP